MLALNIERNPDITPGGKLGSLMRETFPGTWRGNIGFTFQPAWWATNATNLPIWENDGSGSGFTTRNNAHKTICTTEERLQYAPFLGQQIFDTTLNKLLICTNPATKTWLDPNGNPV